jgi:4-methylaminobutanoate oxidase (formaldehyde-forming)
LRAIVLADPRAVTLGSEPVRIDGAVVGRVTSGGYGFRVGQSIAYAYLPAGHADFGRPVDVEVFGEWVGGEVVRDPIYDPTGARIRAA